jgi:hypothetical protein
MCLRTGRNWKAEVISAFSDGTAHFMNPHATMTLFAWKATAMSYTIGPGDTEHPSAFPAAIDRLLILILHHCCRSQVDLTIVKQHHRKQCGLETVLPVHCHLPLSQLLTTHQQYNYFIACWV